MNRTLVTQRVSCRPLTCEPRFIVDLCRDGPCVLDTTENEIISIWCCDQHAQDEARKVNETRLQ